MRTNLNRKAVIAIVMSLAGMLAGCQTSPPDSKPKQGKTIAYYLRIESSEPGVSIETNKVYAGKTPLTLQILGDAPGTFHDFGSPEYILRALPLTTNQFLQTKAFRTGKKGSAQGDRIPGLIFFDMSQPSGALLIDTFPDK